ncbi:MAG TPA: pilus assembly protein TadG-related protein [Terriglobales bacterium]|nr:pilus assembly protein TadG-related protein [Terriglobales bacterium]
MNNRTKKREKGTVLVTTAVSMVAIIAVLGLAIDMGVLYTARTSAQHAADAAALAGAYAYLVYPSSNLVNSAYGGDVTQVATKMAQDTATQNQILGNSLTTSDLTITFPAANRVTVVVQKSIPTYFIKVLGRFANVPVRAQATAEADTSASASSCLRPFWITASALQGGSCSGSTLPVGTALKLWTNGGLSPSSQWGLVGQSAATIRDQIESCSGIVNACQKMLTAKPGATTGGVLPAMQDVICPDEGGNCNPCPSDPTVNCGDWTWQGPNDYLHDGVTGPSSPAVMTIALWDDCNGPGPKNGRGDFPIAGYAQIFVTDVGNPSNKGIDAKFLQLNSCPAGGGGTGGGATGPGALPLRLINP